MVSRSRIMRWLVAVAVVVPSMAGVAGYAEQPTSAVCTFFMRGSSDDPESFQAITPSKGKLFLAGSISCQGSWRGQQLTPELGTISVTGNGHGPISSAYGGTTCVYGEEIMRMDVTLPQAAGVISATGTWRMTRALYWSAIAGDIGGLPFAGYAGWGADPEAHDGTCVNPRDPFHNLSVSGRFTIGGTTNSSVPHQVLVTAFQEVPSGNINVPIQPTNHVTDLPVYRGDTITWTNADVLPHSITSCDRPCVSPYPNYPEPSGEFDGWLVQAGDSYTLDTETMEPGVYTYYCRFHRYVRASFEVQERPALVS